MTILLYAQYGHLAIWPCTTKEGKWDIPEKRIKCSSAVKSQFWVEMVHFFGTVLDILFTKHTNSAQRHFAILTHPSGHGMCGLCLA